MRESLPSVHPRLLITGVTGLLGHVLADEAQGHYEVWGLARHPDAVTLPCKTLAVDLLDELAVIRALKTVRPEIVIHTAAMTSVDECEVDPARAFAINVGATQHVLRALVGRPCRVIFISTDAVFDGTRGNYTEDNLPAPLHVYGRTKWQAEEAVLTARPDALVVRTVFYGWSARTQQKSLAERILSTLREGREFPGFVDLAFSPILTNHLARALLRLASMPITGRLHVAGGEACSKYEFARRVAITLGFPVSRIVPAMSEGATGRVPRPKNVTLSVTRAARVLGHALPGLVEGLNEFVTSSPALVSSSAGAR